ncbi:Alpha/Beta hydrolase protein [Podospora fimiseda]|uniref:Alpha/Beta hydrolase protein n=1 Tax=Podospora fimiseda TaxID=252190 RepID=A0AAN7GNG0_9PEZI|nr:Alpha/Beta hydrolase protein [Podospora fimiseda]
MPRHRPVECKTLDGTSISGWLYTVDGPAPAIIMSHGFNCVKEMTLPDVAEAFNSLGYNVLLYDARSVGGSGGQPRNLLNPLQMAEDLSDIYTYVAGLPSVDASKIVLWGMSFGGVVSATCAAVDRRAKAVVMVCPLFHYVAPHKEDKAYAQLMKDRISQLRGNEPYELAPFNSKGDNPIGMPGGMEAYTLMTHATKFQVPGYRDRLCLQTYQKLAMFRPKEYMDMIKAPTMMVIPELDGISPPEEQREALGRVKAPKREYFAKGKGHLNIATGSGAKELIAATAAFFKDALEGKIE